MSHRGPLPDYLVETLFARLLQAYGVAFRDQYRGMDMVAVRQHWAEQLGGFYQPEVEDEYARAPAIEYALDNLPVHPLNVLEFRRICQRYMAPPTRALPPPKADAERLRREFAKLRTPADPRPEAVRVADRYIRLHGVKSKLTDRERQLLQHYQGVLAQWNREQERRARQQAAQAQQKQEAAHGATQ